MHQCQKEKTRLLNSTQHVVRLQFLEASTHRHGQQWGTLEYEVQQYLEISRLRTTELTNVSKIIILYQGNQNKTSRSESVQQASFNPK